MPEITLKYEHPHELTDLLGKLMQMYVVPEPTCRDMPYPENYAQSEGIGKCLGTITVGESVSVLEAKLKGAEKQALIILESYNVVCGELNNLKLELAQCKEKLINTQSELDAAKNHWVNWCLSCESQSELDATKIYIDCLTTPKKDDSQDIINTSDTAFIADSDIQVFTLEEAAEYLEINTFNVFSLMNDGDLKCQGFLLSDLRKIKKSWESSV